MNAESNYKNKVEKYVFHLENWLTLKSILYISTLGDFSTNEK
jgi:hypothetical protein